MTANVSWLELAWILVAIWGFIATTYHLYLLRGDMRALKRDPTYIQNGPRHLTITGSMRSESTRVLTMFGFLVVGAVVGTLPNPPEPWNIRSVIFAGVFLGISMLMAIDATLRIRQRNKVLRSLEEIEHEKVVCDGEESCL